MDPKTLNEIDFLTRIVQKMHAEIQAHKANNVKQSSQFEYLIKLLSNKQDELDKVKQELEKLNQGEKKQQNQFTYLIQLLS